MRRLQAVTLLGTVAAALTLASCGGDGPTAPKQSVRVDLAVTTQGGPAFGADSTGQATIACSYTFTARATGQGSAVWTDGMMRLTVGQGGTTGNADSLAFSSADMVTIWGAATLAAGQTQTTSFSITASIPITGELSFRYRDGNAGDVSTTSVKFACSPPVPANAAAPEITALTVTPPSGTLPVGAPLTVHYDVSAPAGTWETILEITGPCTVRKIFAEQALPAVSRTQGYQLPSDCRLGEPLRVAVTAIDAAGRTTGRALTTSLVLADLDPPRLFVSFPSPFGGSLSPTPVGEFFRGDSLGVYLQVSDNYKLSSVAWELQPGGTKDSLFLSAQSASVQQKLRIPADGTGDLQVSMYARDAVGLTSPVAAYTIGAAHLHPSVVRPAYSGTIAGEARASVLDSKRGLLYVAEGNEHRVVVVAVPAMTVVGTVPLPGAAFDVDLTPGGDSLLVAFFGGQGLGVVDLRASPLALSVLPLTVLDPALGQFVTHVRAMANGHALISLAGTTLSGYGLADVNLATGVARLRAEASADGAADEFLVERSLDARVAVLEAVNHACVRRYVIDTDSFGACVAPRVRGWQPTMDATGSRVAIGADVYDASMQLLPQTGPQIIPGNSVAYSALSADGGSVFEMLTFGTIRLASADGSIIDRSPVVVMPSIMPRLSSDGTMMVLINRQNTQTSIGIVDLR